ncbi:MAG TPA: hypothetical protein VJQ43_04060 [Thermoplasmata archaeon]|nr:hypothetical protein [Thermoplasmata archaeon]
MPGSADPAAKAYPFTAWSVLKRPLPNEVRDRLEGWPLATFRPRAIDALGQLGFYVAADMAPTFPPPPKPGKPARKIRGILVGERGLRMDDALRGRARIRMWAAAGIAAAGGVATFFLIPYRGWTALTAILTGLSAGVAMTSAQSRGAFDSEIVYVIYEATPNFSAGPPPTDATPLTIEVRSASARISSVNWSGKFGSGRSFKAVVPGGPDLSGIAPKILQSVRG